MSKVLIKPPIGRRIWFWPGQVDLHTVTPMRQVAPEQPFDAGIIYVYSDTCVNLQITDHQGGIWFRERVSILLEGEDQDPGNPYGVAQWMHYQVGQAAREAERASEKAVSPPEDTATHQTSLSETAWREANIPKASNWPRITGVSREPNYSRALTVYFERTPTYDELRAFHDYLRSAPSTWALAQTKAEADSQPAPEYVGNGMFKGETIEKAAEHWANWCDRRCMNGLAEFLRVVAAHALANSVTAPAGEAVVETLTKVQIDSLLYKHGFDPDDEHMAEMLQAAVSLKRTPHAG